MECAPCELLVGLLMNYFCISEDELFLSNNTPSARQVNKQLSRQLARDGFQLDEVPDDEALDLIPPSDFRDPSSCNCCSIYYKECCIL